MWLKAKRARVVRQDPFTIRLRFATQTFVQPAKVGVDTGSKDVGIAATSNGEVVFQAEVHLRDDITNKLTRRRQYQRTRRARKIRYREPRWRTRRRKAGWLPPSISSKAEATVKVVCLIASFLPVGQVCVEVGRFDTQKMQNAGIAHLDYQRGELHGYFLRAYVLEKWQRTCAYCGAREVPLEIEHIVPKSRGGSNRTSNLTLACHPCNERKGQQTAAEFGFPEVQAKARVPLKDAAHVSALKTRVVDDLQAIFGESRVSITYGYETTYKRIQVLDLPKSHANDAVAIALYELVKAKGEVGYISGRREKGAFVIKDVTSGKKLLEGHTTQTGTSRTSHPGLDDDTTASPGEHQKGGRHLLPQLKRGGTRVPLSWIVVT